MNPVTGRIPKVWILLLACLFLMGELAYIARRYDDWLGINDFIEYWSAGQLLRRGQNPYNFEALYAVEKKAGWVEERPLVMWNPPWLLVLLYPLLMPPFGVAATMWFGLSLGILLGCTVLTWCLFVPLTSPARLLLPLLATVIFAPALLTLRMGQVSVLLLLGIAGFLHLERRGRDLWAGAFLVLLTLKPHVTYLLWVAIIWWVITTKRWKVLRGLGGALGVLWAFLTSLRPGWVLDYLIALRHPPLYWRVPVLGCVLRILGGWDRTWLQYLPPLILCSLLLVLLHRRGTAFAWEDVASPLLLLSVPTAAYGWSFDQLVLLVPYLQMVAWLSKRHHGRPLPSLMVATGLLSINGLMLWANARLRDDLYLLGGALAWGSLYLVAQWMLLGQPWLRAAPIACSEEEA